MPERMYSPSPTVRSSRVPLYLRGLGLGQDPYTDALAQIDASQNVMADPTGQFITDLDTGLVLDAQTGVITQQNGMIIPQTAAGAYTVPITAADVIPTASASAASAVAAAGGTVAQQTAAANAVKPGATPTQIAAAVANAMKTVGTATVGPSPRIAIPAVPASSLLTQSSIIKGIPDIAVFGLGFVLLLAAGRR